ncbi:MAG: hypothetical protein JKX91_06515 [Rhizobiaceae bacterium]|nr:hypothetical protein [Rhizobiaceae bacterium]
MSKLIESDGDVHEIYHKDNHTGQFHIEIVQDVAAYLRANKEEFNVTEKRTTWKGDFHKVASIPEVVVAQWWKELGSNPFSKENKPWLVAKLNSNEFYRLRTRAGTI